jgi:16S rRNA processing protein RimM
VAVVANPAADLIELDGGALIPVAFVVDHAPGTLTVDPPDGLLDI